MRYVRMLGRTKASRSSLLVAMALCAALGTASPAMAAKEGSSNKGEAKDFAQCPIALRQVVACVFAKSGPGSEFQAGKITVPLNKPEVLQGGLSQVGEQTEFWGAEAGNNTTLKPVPQEVPGGLEANINPAELSGSALAAYEKAIAGGKTKVTASIELTGPPHPRSPWNSSAS